MLFLSHVPRGAQRHTSRAPQCPFSMWSSLPHASSASVNGPNCHTRPLVAHCHMRRAPQCPHGPNCHTCLAVAHAHRPYFHVPHMLQCPSSRAPVTCAALHVPHRMRLTPCHMCQPEAGSSASLPHMPHAMSLTGCGLEQRLPATGASHMPRLMCLTACSSLLCSGPHAAHCHALIFVTVHRGG